MPTETPILDIELSKITLSEFKAQQERRGHFNQQKLDELAGSLERVGQLQPVLVRPVGTDRYELIAGERRYLAAKICGWTHIVALVRPMTDGQAIESQLFENLDREDLHPMAEAEGYEQLTEYCGHDIAAIAQRVGRSEQTIVRRMKLLNLCDQARKAFYRNDFNGTTAAAIAKLNHKLQRRLLKDIKPHPNREWSDQDIRRHILQNFTLALKHAPFDPADADLAKNAGACTGCSRQSANQPALFPELEQAEAVCGDVECFQMKVNKHVQRLARDFDGEVLKGNAAKEVWPTPYGDPGGYGTNGWKDIDSRDWTAQKSYRQLLGKKFLPDLVLVVNPWPMTDRRPDSKGFAFMCREADLKRALKAKGVRNSLIHIRTDAEERQAKTDREAKKRDKAVREAVDSVLVKLDCEGDIEADLQLMYRAVFDGLGYDTRERLAVMYGVKKGEAWGWKPFEDERISADPGAFILRALLLKQMLGWETKEAATERFLELAKAQGFDVSEVL